MGIAKLATLTAIGVALSTGCAQPTDGQQTQNATVPADAAVKTAKEIAVVAFVNDLQTATFDVLDVDCAIRSNSAQNIIAHRDGDDQTPGTADDNLFDSVGELDGVSQVGEWTIDQLTLCADSFGFRPSDEDLALLNFLNDYVNTTFERLDVDCNLYSNAVENLIAHRDGPDGVSITFDDDPFYSANEVDEVPQVGEASMSKLYACAKSFGYDGQLPWSPIPVAATLSSEHLDLLVWQSDGIIHMDNSNAPQGPHVHIEFDGHVLGIKNGYGGMWTNHLANSAPEGYGAEDIGVQNGLTRVRVTTDPVDTITTWQALEIARADLIEYIQDVRMHQQDWHNQLPQIDTWEAALAEGIMDGIEGFCNPAYDSDFSISRTPEEYRFTDRGPLGLHTRVHVSKSSEQGVYFYVEID